MRPWLLRRACVGSDSIQVFSGSSVVPSSNPDTDMKRRPGLVGLNFLIGILSLDAPEEAFDLLAFAKSHDRLLPIGGVADRAAGPALAAATLATHRYCVHVFDLDARGLVLLLEGLLDVGLGSALGDAEGVAALRVELVGPLGDDRPDHDFRCCTRCHLPLPLRSRALKFSSRGSRHGEGWGVGTCGGGAVPLWG